MIIFVQLKELDIHLEMKNNKPSEIILIGSAIVVATTFIFTFALHLFVLSIPLWVIIVLPIVVGLTSFYIFYSFVERFINDRLKVVYRSIRRGKTKKDQKPRYKMNDEVFDDAEVATKEYSDNRQLDFEKLQEQEKYRREFLGNLAHELKTPVFSIQGYILTLLDGGLEDEKVNRQFLERASIATDRMVALLEDLDGITKMESNTLKLDWTNFSIGDLTKEVIDSFEIIAAEKKIKLNYPKEMNLKVHADRAKITQVLSNLINNSITYGNENGETNVRLFQMNDLILVEVADNGPGIQHKYLHRLFERFFRIEKSRTRNEGGSGLGLAIAKHIVESHGQSLTVRSTVGMGSTFAFTLDAAKTENEMMVTSRGVKIH